MPTSNDLNISQAGYVAFDGTATFYGRTFQAGTGITISNPDGIAGNSTISATGAGTVEELTGNSGTATPDGSGNINVITANSTAKFVGASHTLTEDFGLDNLLIGSAGASLSGFSTENVGLGLVALNAAIDNASCTAIGAYAMQNASSGAFQVAVGSHALQAAPSSPGNSAANTAVGYQSLLSLTNGTGNCCLGANTAGNLVTGRSNIAIGSSAMAGLTSTPSAIEPNIAIGFSSLAQLLTGGLNIAIGYNAGFPFTTNESNNILIGNLGIIADNNTIRIGTQGSGSGQQNLCFIAGITGVTTSNSNMVTIDTTTGQLGASSIPPTFTWSETSGTFTPAKNNGYFITNTATANLPASPLEGDTISFAVDTSNFLTINANTGQIIRLNTSVTATAGNAVNVAQGSTITLVYKTTGAVWMSISANGNWTLT